MLGVVYYGYGGGRHRIVAKITSETARADGSGFSKTKSPKVEVFKDGLLDGFLHAELCEGSLLVFILN
jgi:hypothetical protein